MTTDRRAIIDGKLLEKVRDLHTARLRQGLLRTDLAQRRAVFESSVESLTRDLRNATEEMDEADKALREDGVLHFLDFRDKHPVPGLDIDETTEMKYDPDGVLAWAQKEARIFVVPESLNVKAFEQFAKTAAPWSIPTLATAKVPKATVATDLGKALRGAGIDPESDAS